MVSSVVESIFLNAREHPEKIAIIDGTSAVSYGDFCSKILAAKSLLEAKRIGNLDRVILLAAKEPNAIYLYFAAHLVGAIPIPLDPATAPKHLAVIERLSKAKVIFSRGGIDLDTLIQEHSSSLAHDWRRFSDFPDRNSLSDILFTSGTTGTPKGVMLSHTNHLAAARNINEFIGNDKVDVELLALPLSHSFGLGRLRCVLVLGGTLVLVDGFARPKRIFEAIEKHAVSGLGLVPAAWSVLYGISKDYIGRYADRLKYIEIGSSPMELWEKRKLIDFLPKTRICMHYGLTEASRAAFIEFHSQKQFLDTIGQASPNVEITIRDAKGNKCSVGREGEICIQGDIVGQGYWQDEERTKHAFWGEVFRTGDRGVMNESGFIFLKGRAGEMINVGGRKVSPIEIEEVLRRVRGIKDCACIGVPDAISGEAITAFVVADEKPVPIHNVISYLRLQIEPYKIPQSFKWIDDIPKTTSGKIKRFSLKSHLKT